MIHLKVLSGASAGRDLVTRRFPFRIGRGAQCGLRLEEPGVWDHHFEIRLGAKGAFELVAHHGALTTVQDQPVQAAPLRNGDRIGAGNVKMIFSLSPTTQRSLRWREWMTWAALIGLCLGQIALIYWMPG